MRVPDKETARMILDKGHERNPGPWKGHSLYTAKACSIIAGRCDGMDAEAAYVSGLLHDIGRREGVFFMRHVIDGYRYLSSLGYDDAARICLTHSFACKNVNAIFGVWDCPGSDVEFIQEYLERTEYNDYDRLVQLCDNLALSDGFCLLEKRMIDVQMRYGVNEYTVPKWKATFELLEYFNDRTGSPIYSMLPGVAETTFELERSQLKPRECIDT